MLCTYSISLTLRVLSTRGVNRQEIGGGGGGGGGVTIGDSQGLVRCIRGVLCRNFLAANLLEHLRPLDSGNKEGWPKVHKIVHKVQGT